MSSFRTTGFTRCASNPASRVRRRSSSCPPARKGDQQHFGASGSLPQATTRLVAVELRHSQIERHDIGSKPCGRPDRFQAIVSRGDLVADQRKQSAETARGVAIVVRHKDSPTAWRACVLRSRRSANRLLGRAPREAQDEFAALADACAASLDRSAMQSRESMDDRQADAEPAVGSLERPIRLEEHREDLRQLFRAMPMPLSFTEITTSVPSRTAESEMRPPGPVNLQALLSRLASIWDRRTGSASTQSGSAVSATESS